MQQLINSGIFSKKVIFKRNAFIKSPGTIDTKIYFIKSGSVKISIQQENDEQIIRFGYVGDLIVALDSFITEQASDFFMQTIKESEVLIAEKTDFMAWVNASKENTALYVKILEDLVLQQIEREKDLLIDNPKERYERVLKRNPNLFQVVANKHIANYLRMSPETLSRLKKR